MVKQIILPIFYDVDPSEVRHQKLSFGEAFAKLRYKLKDEVNVTKWEAALEKVANLSRLELGDKNELEFIQDIIKGVDSKVVNRTFLKVAKHPVGIESRVRDIYQHLSMERNDIVCMVGIFGTGGIDDVDELKQLETLAGDRKWFGPRSRIIELKILANDEARKLFSLRAFKKEEPLDGYAEVFEQVMEYAQGLPLALTVLGSNLKDKTIREWESALDEYKQIPDKNIQGVLQESYDGLEEHEKDMFLDIGTNNVEGIKVVLPEGHNHDDMIRLSPKAFAKMKRLRYFISRGACFSGGVLSYLSNELRVLDWSNCHLPSLPSNFHGEKLVVFKMNEGRIKEINCWKFKNLTVMKFSKCKFLSNILDVSSCSNLERLDIEMCENLVEVHDFVGFLDKLLQNQKELCLSDYSIMLKEDERYSSINVCFTGIEHLSIEELDLSKSAIVSLPPSIESFVKLRILKLHGCKKLQEILHLPPNIQELDAYKCHSLERFPEVSTKFPFYTCGLQELRWIDLTSCHKLDVNIGSLEPNPSFLEEHIQDHSCGITFPGNKIPDWFSHTKETSNGDHSCELDIHGPLYLDKIIGIVFCVVLRKSFHPCSGVSPHFCVSINGNRLVNYSWHEDWYDRVSNPVYLNYSFPESIEQWLRYPTGDTEFIEQWLRYSTRDTESFEQWLRYPKGDNLRFIFESEPGFKSCGVHIISKVQSEIFIVLL
ncbi:disease resistance protein RUN1-like [Juglans regia]|uniref:Disease resistance protein RUN1-like n=1 Tax=Juglans regia TaxID=51240 RepID=A0A6P9E5X4_JUGRE|nr:disease resistance protein RUN1-like [Juglans regia]